MDTFWAQPWRKPELTIPEVRDHLLLLAFKYDDPEIAYLVSQLIRRPAIRRAPTVSVPLTPELARAIRAYAKAHPDMTEHQISVRFGVNQGRVSEALHGKRGTGWTAEEDE